MRLAVVVGAVATLVAAAACASTAAKRRPVIAVTGVVLSAPRCPGPERADQPCPPGPVNNAVVDALSAAKTVASTRTAVDGGFRLTLPAGHYLIRATNVGGYRSTAQRSVDVRTGALVRLTLTLDTGMR